MNRKQFKFNRRDFFKFSSSALITAGLTSSFLFNFNCKKNKDEVRIGYIPITDASPLLIAHSNGFFKDEGLMVHKPLLIRNWSSLVEAFLADKVNVVHLLLPIPIWMRYKNKTPVKIIAWDHTNGSALTVSEKSNIKEFSDLGGKQIAVPYWFSMHNVILQLGLRKYGLKPVIKSQNAKLKSNEVNLFILPPPEMPVALGSDKIDGYIVAEPFNAIGENKISAKIMRFTGDIWKNHPCCVIVVKEKLIKNNPIMTQKITNAVVNAQLWINSNRKKTANILSKEGEGYLPASEKVLLRVFEGYENKKYGISNLPHAIRHPEWKINRIDFQPYPYPSATNFIFEQLKKTIVDGDNSFLSKYESNFIIRDLVETSFVKNAINNIGGPGKFPSINLNSPWEREEIIEV